MPRLTVAVPCQKAILDRDDGTVSLIGLINGAVAIVPRGMEVLPADAGVPTSWAFVTTWRKQDGDEQRRFQQRMEVRSPSGDVHQHGELDWQFGPDSQTHNNIIRANGMYTGEAGTHTILVLYREVGQEDWIEAGSYPLEIVHRREEEMENE